MAAKMAPFLIGLQLCAVPLCVQMCVSVFLTRFLAFSDSTSFVCTLSWVAACNLPNYCLLAHRQKVQFMSNQARTLRLCWTLPAAKVRQLRWRRTGGACNVLRACYMVLRRSGPVNESNTHCPESDAAHFGLKVLAKAAVANSQMCK